MLIINVYIFITQSETLQNRPKTKYVLKYIVYLSIYIVEQQQQV